jgi:hypothetical protein
MKMKTKKEEAMKIGSLAAAAIFGFMILWVQGVAAEAAEVKVLSAAAMRSVMKELGPRFERETGHQLTRATELHRLLGGCRERDEGSGGRQGTH